jgi:hypothetical protein
MHIKKGAESFDSALLTNFPAASYSPVTPSATVPSALRGLTAVFGMGTGVTPSPWRPETSCRRLLRRRLSSDKLKVGSYKCGYRAWRMTWPRDGSGLAIRKLATWVSGISTQNKCSRYQVVKPHGRLVPVSSTPYSASTSGLSTSLSRRGL